MPLLAVGGSRLAAGWCWGDCELLAAGRRDEQQPVASSQPLSKASSEPLPVLGPLFAVLIPWAHSVS
jgi:hypothetical protein